MPVEFTIQNILDEIKFNQVCPLSLKMINKNWIIKVEQLTWRGFMYSRTELGIHKIPIFYEGKKMTTFDHYGNVFWV